ncbi:MAG: DUF4097 family beta strand repeat-containing protein [bacterium]|nr:DUF4097 family beta strand repeat-containing protein [bacterium]
MSVLQKIIKYLTLSFAIFLTFNIMSGIMYGISFIGTLFDDKINITEKLNDLEINNNTLLLDIEVLSSNITIKKGDAFKVQTNNKFINCKQDNNKLYLIEKKHNWFHNINNSELIIYIPINFVFDSVSIESGAGKINIETLSTKQLYLNLGAGKADIENLTVLENAKIDGGAGDLNISAIDIHNLDLSMGIGKFSLISKLVGNNKIDLGIGEVNLTLIGTLDDYQIFLDKGVGKSTIDGNSMKDNKSYGTGINKLDIDGGIGSINIDFKNLRG